MARAIRGIGPDWLTGQLLKASLYRIVVMCVTTGASIRQAIALHWDRVKLGPPPSEQELRQMVENFRASLG